MYSPASLFNYRCKLTAAENEPGKFVSTGNDKEFEITQLVQIKEYISEKKTREARTLLRKAISEDMENAEIYNLLGISYEVDGNRLKASKFYRVSYYMDQTFKAASDNLDRICKFNYNPIKNAICWGIDIEEVKK